MINDELSESMYELVVISDSICEILSTILILFQFIHFYVFLESFLVFLGHKDFGMLLVCLDYSKNTWL